MNLSSIDLNLLVVFDALITDGSVTGAARRVGLSQPAFSNALARLRGALGDPLFVRSGRGLATTPRARELVEPIRRALGELRIALEPRAAFEPAQARRTFVLMMSDLAELMLMPPLTARVRRLAPGIELRVRQYPTASPREMLAGPNAPDLVITMLPDADRSPCAQPLMQQRFVCIVRRGHPRVGARMSLARFLQLEHVLVAPTGEPGGVIDDLLAARGLERRIALTLAHFVAAAMVVSRTDLVMSATSSLAEVAARILPVRAVRHPLPTPTVTIGQLWHPSQDADPAHRWLRHVVAEAASPVGADRR